MKGVVVMVKVDGTLDMQALLDLTYMDLVHMHEG